VAADVDELVRSARRPIPISGIDPYPPSPSAVPGADHRVRVSGRPVFVETSAGVSYVRFAMRRPVDVEIEVRRPIAGHSIDPVSRFSSASITGTIIRFALPEPGAVVVRIVGLEPLFVLADPPDADPPVGGSPGVIDVTDAGADPTGQQLATGAIQAALDAAASRPSGGIVLIPPGTFRSGTLILRSNVTLHLAPGALLQGSDDPADYPIDPGRYETAGDASLAPDARYLGRTMTYSRLLLVDRAEHVRIRGRGTIDGAGTVLRTQRGAAPNLLRVRESQDVVIEDVLFRNAAAWSLHVLASRDVAMRNVKVINDRTTLNTDGIDLDMSTDVSIERAFIHTKDDAICVKASGNSDLTGDPARITVTDCLVSSLDAALKVGTETAATKISDIVFEDVFVFDSGRAMSVVVRDGAIVERVTFRRIWVGSDVDHLVEQVIGVRDPEAELGLIRDLVFEDVVAPTWTAPASNWTWYAQFRAGRPGRDTPVDVFAGADPVHAVDGLTFRRFVVNGRHLTDASTARDVAHLTIGSHVRNVTFD
jgi:hypothetical protein